VLYVASIPTRGHKKCRMRISRLFSLCGCAFPGQLLPNPAASLRTLANQPIQNRLQVLGVDRAAFRTATWTSTEPRKLYIKPLSSNRKALDQDVERYLDGRPVEPVDRRFNECGTIVPFRSQRAKL
jgi:hypothetical protein